MLLHMAAAHALASSWLLLAWLAIWMACREMASDWLWMLSWFMSLPPSPCGATTLSMWCYHYKGISRENSAGFHPAKGRTLKPSTAARGYGHHHQRLRQLLLAQWQPGDPCTRCGQPMWTAYELNRWGRLIAAIHLGHTDDRTGYRGLEHAHCNESDGATRGNQARQPRMQSRNW